MCSFVNTFTPFPKIPITQHSVEVPLCQQLTLTRTSDTLRIRPVVSCGALTPTSLAILAIGPFAVLALHLSSTIRSLHHVGSRLIVIVHHLRCVSYRNCRTHELHLTRRRDYPFSCRSLGSLTGRHLGPRGCRQKFGLRPRFWKEPQRQR